MAFKLIEWINNVTKLNKTTMDTFQNNIKDAFDEAFPIGKIEIFFDNGDHSNYMGFTWEKVAEGKMLVGVGTGTDKNSKTKTFVAGNNEGEYEHKQLLNELARHRHEDIYIDSTTSLKWAQMGIVAGDIGFLTNQSAAPNIITTGYTSNPNAMNITNPCYGAYIWQRIS